MTPKDRGRDEAPDFEFETTCPRCEEQDDEPDQTVEVWMDNKHVEGEHAVVVSARCTRCGTDPSEDDYGYDAARRAWYATVRARDDEALDAQVEARISCDRHEAHGGKLP